MNSILYNGKMRVENQTKTKVWEDSSLCPEISTKNAFQEFRLRFLLKNSCCPGFHQRSPTLHTDSESDALVIANSESELEREEPVPHLQVQLVFRILTSSVADPGSGAFLTPRSGMGKKSGSGSGMNNPDHKS